MRNSITAKRERTDLRWGFSTGACLTALCCAAYESFHFGLSEKEIQLLFPDNEKRTVPLLLVEKGTARLQKDGGDDPDITNGAFMSVTVRQCTSTKDPRDYELCEGLGQLFLHGKSGVGFCTRNGLPCENGKWAINPVPREMVLTNLIDRGFGTRNESLRFEITVENGSTLAMKTLNEKLGIIGGISLLGTTGRVRPYSHKAYIDTIKMVVHAAVTEGNKNLLFATGTRTSRMAQKICEFEDEQVILIGDYIQESLQSAEDNGIESVIVACMPGKLSKYAAGFTNTHAHKNAQNLSYLQSVITKLYPQKAKIPDTCPSVREALYPFSHIEQVLVLKELEKIALEVLQSHAPKLNISIFLCDFNGEVLQ